MSKCYFCGEETKGRKFVGKNFFTHEKEEFDVCENCYGLDLEAGDQRANGGKSNESSKTL